MDVRDVFIAYHGTYDDYGSLNKAKELFYYLESLRVKCYFFPTEQSGYFAETPIAVKNAKKFLLVCNQHIKTDQCEFIKNVIIDAYRVAGKRTNYSCMDKKAFDIVTSVDFDIERFIIKK